MWHLPILSPPSLYICTNCISCIQLLHPFSQDAWHCTACALVAVGDLVAPTQKAFHRRPRPATSRANVDDMTRPSTAQQVAACRHAVPAHRRARKGVRVGWHYLSKSACLMQPRLLYVFLLSCQGSPELGTLLAMFEEHMCQTSSARQVVPPECSNPSPQT